MESGCKKQLLPELRKSHDEISILQYHDENSLSCTIQSGILFCKRILYDHPGTADRKRFCRYLHDPKKNTRR